MQQLGQPEVVTVACALTVRSAAAVISTLGVGGIVGRPRGTADVVIEHADGEVHVDVQPLQLGWSSVGVAGWPCCCLSWWRTARATLTATSPMVNHRL